MTRFTLGYLQDCAEIRELSVRYNLYANAADGESYAQLFTEDGEFWAHGGEHIYRGRVELAQVASAATEIVHITTDPLIEVNGDEATQTSQLVVAHRKIDKSENEFVATGTYTDLLVRSPDGWRFKRRQSDLHLRDDLLLAAMGLADDPEWKRVNRST